MSTDGSVCAGRASCPLGTGDWGCRAPAEQLPGAQHGGCGEGPEAPGHTESSSPFHLPNLYPSPAPLAHSSSVESVVMPTHTCILQAPWGKNPSDCGIPIHPVAWRGSAGQRCDEHRPGVGETGSETQLGHLLEGYLLPGQLTWALSPRFLLR